MGQQVLHIAIILLLAGIVYAGLTPDVNAKIGTIEECKDHKDLPMHYSNMRIDNMGNNKYSIGGFITIREEIGAKEPLKFAMIVKKCKKPGAECETFMNIDTDDACKQLNNKEGAISKVFEKCDKTVTCPIQPGNYTIKDYILKVSEQGKSFVEVSRYWQVHSEASSGGKQLMCSFMDGELTKSQPSKKFKKG